jgi:hypothetical protein
MMSGQVQRVAAGEVHASGLSQVRMHNVPARKAQHGAQSSVLSTIVLKDKKTATGV